MFIALARQVWILQWREKWQLSQPVLFFILSGIVLAIGIGPDSAVLQRIAPGLLWVLVLLSLLLSLENLFISEWRNGILEQWLLERDSLLAIVSIKLFVHWLSHIFPVLLATLPLAVMFHVSEMMTLKLLSSLLLGTPLLIGLGGIIAALMVTLVNQSILLALLLLPLTVPVLIFGIIAVVADGALSQAAFELLGAGFLLSFSLSPWLISQALTIGIA